VCSDVTRASAARIRGARGIRYTLPEKTDSQAAACAKQGRAADARRALAKSGTRTAQAEGCDTPSNWR